MKKSEFKDLQLELYPYFNEFISNEKYNTAEGTSSNNQILMSTLDCLDEILQYYNTVGSGAILNSFCDQYGDSTLKESSKDKLISWLKDESISFLFESDLIIERACRDYKSASSFLHSGTEENQLQLDRWLGGKKLTYRQKNIIESDLCSYIDEDQDSLYTTDIKFEFTLPKKTILTAYMNYVRGQR